jgi:mono/diheme cytochrome c family protein
MEMQGLSDEDLVAVISFLRTQPPVRNPVPAHQFTLLGNVLKATVFAKPIGPTGTPLATSPSGATLENGRYLAESVALCWACHTQRDQASGALTGPRYGGATGFTEVSDPGRVWAPPNITSDPTTGRLAAMTEDEFVARLRAGRLLPGSPMPWQAYQYMAEDDMRAIYRFLKTVPPAVNDVGPPVTNAK